MPPGLPDEVHRGPGQAELPHGEHEVRGVVRQESRTAQHEHPVAEGSRGAVQVGRWLTDDRPAAGLGQGGQPLVVPAQGRARQVAGEDDSPGGQVAEHLPGIADVTTGERWATRPGRGVALGVGVRRARLIGVVRVRDEREPEPDVEVDRSGVRHHDLAEAARRDGGRPHCRRDGHPRRGAGRALGGVRILQVDPAGGTQVGEEPHVPAEELHLVDRLRCAHAPRFDRPIGAEDHERDRAVRSLHDRWREVGHGRARGADHSDRRPRDLGQTEGQEPCRALVDPNVQADPARTFQAKGLEGQRGGARPRREDDLAHALMDQLSQEGARQRGGRVHGRTTRATVGSGVGTRSSIRVQLAVLAARRTQVRGDWGPRVGDRGTGDGGSRARRARSPRAGGHSGQVAPATTWSARHRAHRLRDRGPARRAGVG